MMFLSKIKLFKANLSNKNLFIIFHLRTDYQFSKKEDFVFKTKSKEAGRDGLFVFTFDLLHFKLYPWYYHMNRNNMSENPFIKVY